MLFALTKLPLPLPPLHHALLGLLVAACGFSASARELRGDGLPFTCLTTTGTKASGINIQESPGTADLIPASPPIPEPSYPFLGGCAGCIVLLHRRRSGPGNLVPARTDLSGLSLECISSQCSARAPLARRPVDSHRLIARPTSGRAALRPLRAT